MAAATSTAQRDSASLNWLKIIGQLFYWFFALLIVFIVYKSTAWNWALISLFVAVFGYILIFLRNFRRLALFLFITLYLAIDFSVGIYRFLTTNDQAVAAIRESAVLTFFLGGIVERIIGSIVLGFTGALLVVLIPLFIISLVSALYILALHEMEGISWWDATLYIMALILGINSSYITVENGQAIISKEAAKLSIIGGPGHLIVKQGNVVVLERGGKITRVVNAGVVKVKPLETIRNIFILSGQSKSATIEHVLTKDRIPLDIFLKINFQIELASEVEKRTESRIAPNGEALTRKLDDGLYQVYEGTIRKAALMLQRTVADQLRFATCNEQICRDIEVTKWQDVAGGVPEAELRDHFMSHDFDELFELVGSVPGEEPQLRVNKRKIYEIEQAILAQIKPAKVNALGVLVRGVDIVKIEFPTKLKNAIIESMSSGERASGQAQAIALLGNAKTESIALLLDRMITLITDHLPYANEDIVRQFVIILQNIYQGALRDDVLVKDVVEANSDALKALAQSEGPKVFSTGTLADPTQLLLSQVRVND